MSDYRDFYSQTEKGVVTRIYSSGTREADYFTADIKTEEDFFKLLHNILESWSWYINESPKMFEAMRKHMKNVWGCDPSEEAFDDNDVWLKISKLIVEGELSRLDRNMPVMVTHHPDSACVKIQCLKPHKYNHVHDVNLFVFGKNKKPNVTLAIILRYLSLPFHKRYDFAPLYFANAPQRFVPFEPSPPFFNHYTKDGFDMESIVDDIDYEYDVDNLHTWLTKNIEPVIEDYLKLVKKWAK